MSDTPIKVIIENRGLVVSDGGMLQRVATVFIPGHDEYGVYAPEKAHGDALEWIRFFRVRQPGHTFSGETEVHDTQRVYVIRLVEEELKRLQRDENRVVGRNPDGVYYDAHICLKGHVQSSTGFPTASGEYCPKCGAPCISDCPECKTPIRGQIVGNKLMAYKPPSYCHKCGKPYPWMRETMETARELLYHDDKLTLDDRNNLWDLLQYVMSDPKSDLAPAKKKLIEFNLTKAASATREFVLDLMAKYAKEMSQP